MHRHTVLENTVYIVLFAASFPLCLSHARAPSSSAKLCLQQTFLLLYECVTVFISFENVFFRMTFLALSTLLIILAFCATLYELSSEYRFLLSFENDKKHIHSICPVLFPSHTLTRSLSPLPLLLLLLHRITFRYISVSYLWWCNVNGNGWARCAKLFMPYTHTYKHIHIFTHSVRVRFILPSTCPPYPHFGI